MLASIGPWGHKNFAVEGSSNGINARLDLIKSHLSTQGNDGREKALHGSVASHGPSLELPIDHLATFIDVRRSRGYSCLRIAGIRSPRR